MPKLHQQATIALTELRPFGKNPRHHPNAQVKKLVKAIREFGFTTPLLIDEENAVLAGYGRLMAARELGLDMVPCVVVSGLTKAKKLALVISDNKLSSESSWDNDILIENFGEIHADGLDLEFTGFGSFEIENLLSPFQDGPPDPSDTASPAAAITVSVPNATDIPSVAAIIRRAIAAAGYRGIKVKESR